MSAQVVLATLRPLRADGVVFMAACVTLVLVLCGFCFWRILRQPRPSKHEHAPLDIDTHDTD